MVLAMQGALRQGPQRADEMHPQRRWIVIRCIALVACLGLALGLAWNGLSMDEQRRPAGTDQEGELLQKAKSLIQTVHGLEAIRHAPTAPALNALFTVQPHAPAAAGRAAPRPVVQYTVDMIITSGEQGRAIVSGRLTRIGETLPDGSRVVDIQADSVVLDREGHLYRLPAPSGRILQENGP